MVVKEFGELKDYITDGQQYALNKLIGGYTDGRKMRLYVISNLLGKEVESTGDLLKEDWKWIRDRAYKNWRNDDWIVSEEFEQEVYRLVNKFEEEVMGQQKMFNS